MSISHTGWNYSPPRPLTLHGLSVSIKGTVVHNRTWLPSNTRLNHYRVKSTYITFSGIYYLMAYVYLPFFFLNINTLKYGCHNFYLFHLRNFPITNGRKGLTQQAWVAQILTFQNKACLQDWLLGDNLWALGIVCLTECSCFVLFCFVWSSGKFFFIIISSYRVFCVLQALGHAVPAWTDKWILTMWFMVNAGFAEGGGGRAGVKAAEVSHTGTACSHVWPLIKSLDTKAQVNFPGWWHFACVVTHHGWEN